MRINILKSMQLNQIVEMIYMNNHGEISKRRVKVLIVEGNVFRAYCFFAKYQKDF
ncbi:transcriptional regulator [Psychrobacillus sp. FSL K6-1464]|uniref:transcriptional regulator n=1 Tax=Psychrobacillus sp. FSL K6-1464 TaxID=2921545 RepID=UPI0030F9C916